MPRSCSVPGCKTNYGTTYKSVFSFPSEEERRCAWLKAISRKDFTVTKCSGVCIDHFQESDIEREIRATRLDGSSLVMPRKKLKVRDSAVPSIFPALPVPCCKGHKKKKDNIRGNKDSIKVIPDSDNDPSESFPNHGAMGAVRIISEIVEIPFLKEEVMDNIVTVKREPGLSDELLFHHDNIDVCGQMLLDSVSDGWRTVKVKEEPVTDECYVYNEAKFIDVKHESDFMLINGSEDQTLDYVKIEIEDEITTEDHEIFPESILSPDGNIQNSDAESNGLDSGKKLYKCDICGRGFVQNNRLAVHHRSHTTEKPFVCDICGKRFPKKCYLMLHIRIHTRGKLFKCDGCGEEFTQQHSLGTHSCVHNGDNGLKCDVCGKIFECNNVHYRKHSGLKSYKCNICCKSSIHSSNYSVHHRTHTTEKPFTCKVCFRVFRSKSRLTAHVFMHTEQKPFQCGFCGKGFRCRSIVTGHCCTHTRDKLFKCDICNKRKSSAQNA